MNQSIFKNVGKIKAANKVLVEERKGDLSRATFNEGDIVSARVPKSRILPVALMIVSVDSISEGDIDEDLTCTSYSVMDERGRVWNLMHYEGTHEDAEPDEVRLITPVQADKHPSRRA